MRGIKRLLMQTVVEFSFTGFVKHEQSEHCWSSPNKSLTKWQPCQDFILGILWGKIRQWVNREIMYEMATVEHNLGFVHAFRLTLVLPQDKSSFQYVVFLCNNPFTALVAFALSAPRKCCSTQTVTDRIMVLPLSCLRYSKCSSTLCPLFA